MSKISTEEKSPLLYAEEGNDGNGDQKARSRVHFEKHRYRDISAGATKVFTHFPNFVGTFWITTAFFGLLFFMLILLLLSAVTTNSFRVPRCVYGQELDNKTVHLVHAYNFEHSHAKEVQILGKIVEVYKDYRIHLVMIRQEFSGRRKPEYEEIATEEVVKTTAGTTPTKSTSGVTRRRKRRVNDYHMNFNIEAKRLLDMLLHGKIMDKNFTEKIPKSTKSIKAFDKSTTTTEEPATTFEELLENHPDVMVENTTYNKMFFNSPLYAYWPGMNEDLRIFAVRVLQLWQYGGISFDIHPHLTGKTENISATNHTNSTLEAIYNKKVMKFVINEKTKYESLTTGVVAADDEGLHMESKVPCHAFFGELLMKLRRAKETTTVQDVIRSSVALFCKHFAAEKQYCDRLVSN